MQFCWCFFKNALTQHLLDGPKKYVIYMYLETVNKFLILVFVDTLRVRVSLIHVSRLTQIIQIPLNISLLYF